MHELPSYRTTSAPDCGFGRRATGTPFFFPFNYLFTCGCAGSSSLHLDFTCSERGCSLQGLPLLQSTGSVVVAWGLSCSKVCGIFLGQGLNRGPPHCKVDS